MNIFKVLKKALFLLPILGALFLASVDDTTSYPKWCYDQTPTCLPPDEIVDFPCSSDLCPKMGVTCKLCVESPP